MFRRNKKIYISVLSLVMLFSFSGCGNDGQSVVVTEETNTLSDDFGISTETTSSEYVDFEQVYADNEVISVYVCGAVVNPGVYVLESTDIKEKALEMAGGFTEGAATTYVNLAESVKAGEKIYFPYESELEARDFSEDINISDEESDKININTATKDELMTLSGIGESKAEDIITYREEHGGFKSIEEIMNINGIKEGVYNKIKDSIVVN